LCGAEVEKAEDGEQALRLVKEQKPDVVLTDIQMPNMDGVELIKCIKTDTELSAMPVIALSACGKEHL
jgi:YesN/AraC family two-component response regulator